LSSHGAAPMIEYAIQAYSPQARLFRVCLQLAEPAPEGQRFYLPAWIPGSYMIRDFARKIVRIEARCAGAAVALEKLDKQTWRAPAVAGPLELEYDVYAGELSVRAAHLDTQHGFFNGTSVFLAVEGREAEACRVRIDPPDGVAYRTWRLATSLQRQRAGEFSFGTYQAASYADLIDHPVEMGRFEIGGFRVAGVAHWVALTGARRCDMNRLCSDLQAICEQHVALFGELPVDRYLFLITAVGDGYGGLEHATSCSLICKRDDLPVLGEEDVSEGYRSLLGLCSHEYFHLWNVKRIRPRALAGADLRKEAHTTLLWWFEGVTSYYDELALVRSDRIPRNSYLQLLARSITNLLRGSGRHKQSLLESSFDAWTKFYQQDENAPNAIVSYYTKGSLVALALDLRIREDSGGQHSLDDVLRVLWRDCGRTGRGVGEDELEPLIERVVGIDLRWFLHQALRGTADLPLAEVLASVGVCIRLRPARDAEDRGGSGGPAVAEADVHAKRALGVRLKKNVAETVLATVFEGGAAQRAGLAPGDILVAVDGIRARPENLECLVAAAPAGEALPVHVLRRDELLEFQVTPLPAAEDTCDLWLSEQPTPAQRAAIDAWLGEACSEPS